MKKLLTTALMLLVAISIQAQTGQEKTFQTWALTPPMGWNSWDCFGPTVVESEVKENADYMAEKLAAYGWEYVVVDIRWFVENDKAGGYNQTDPIYVYDEYGRYTPALNRFPSAANGVGFKALADYIHGKGLKFGIHLMRGLPKKAAEDKCPVKGAEGITCDMIASNDSACTWLRDNYKVDYTKPGAQEYYNSCFELYAQWGVDFVKIDDLSRPYHTAEIEMIRKAIDNCGRPIVLSISPGETPLDRVDHVKNHANMWRTVDDFWDNWSQLNYQFQVCAKWAPHIAPGTWPDADMLPLGKISIRGERGSERWTNFTIDEQYTMMNLWTIFKSPLMFGGHLPENDDATNALLTNRDVLYMHHYSTNNRQLSNDEGKIIWTANDPQNGDKFVALFNTGGSDFINSKDVLYRSGTISYLTTGYCTDVDVDLPEGSKTLALVVTDGGDGYDCDHADWINPVVTLKDGTVVDLTTQTYLRSTVGWGSVGVNKNINGGTLSIDGNTYSKGFAVHANSILLFEFPQEVVNFKAHAGIDNTGSDQGSKSSVEFMVYNYDATMRTETTDQWNGGNKTIKIDPTKQIACSGFMSRQSSQRTVDLTADITGAEKLYLVVTNGGDGFSYDHANWANPILVDVNGTEVPLTRLTWDADPINGWNAPKINKNNDGNTMTMGGTTYASGIGCNSPSMITYTLPEDHQFTTFKATVGYDDDVNSAASGVTMEFRVFTEDPTPNEATNITLDLTKLGFAADQPCQITEMWSGTVVGTYKNSEFSPLLNQHASGLYRVKATDRAAGASVDITLPTGLEAVSGVPFDVTLSVSGATDGEVMLVCDGEVVGVMTLDATGTAVYKAMLYGGDHTLKAYYSGTASVDCAESAEVMVTVAGEAEDITQLKIQLQSLIDEAEAIDQTAIVGSTRAPLNEAIAAAKPVEGKTKEQLLLAIENLKQAISEANLSLSFISSLKNSIAKAEEFSLLISDGAAKTSLTDAIADANSTLADADATTDDIKEAQTAVENALQAAKLTAQPLPGTSLDMTEFLNNPSFELGTTGWSVSKTTTGWESFATWSDRPAHEGSQFVSLAYGGITSIDLYQNVSGLPAGSYTLKGALRNTEGVGALTTQHIYAQTAAGTYDSDMLTQVSGTNNNDWYDFTVDGIVLAEGENLRLGARSSGTGTQAGWFQADDFRLYYFGATTTGIDDVQVAENRMVIMPVNGGVVITSATARNINIYSLAGTIVKSVRLTSGYNTISLAAGCYVVGGKVIAVR